MNKIRDFVEKNAFYILLVVCISIIALSGVWALWERRAEEEGMAVGSAPEIVQELAEASMITLYRPVSGEVIRYFEQIGYDPSLSLFIAHEGVDVSAAQGETVRCAQDGTITMAGRDARLGGVVEIEHQEGISTRYAGLAWPISLRVGDSVEAGGVIGKVSSIPIESEMPAHLHFELWMHGEAKNPADYLIN